MALGATLKMADVMVGSDQVQAMRPVQVAGSWLVAIDPDPDPGEDLSVAGLNAADNSGSDITNPDTQIILATRHIINLQMGPNNRTVATLLRVRMRYDDGLTISTTPLLQFFGRGKNADGSYQQWQRLRNKAGAIDIELAGAASDVTDGTDKWTTCHNSDHLIDLDGCIEILPGVKRALTGTGTVATAQLEVKGI